MKSFVPEFETFRFGGHVYVSPSELDDRQKYFDTINIVPLFILHQKSAFLHY